METASYQARVTCIVDGMYVREGVALVLAREVGDTNEHLVCLDAPSAEPSVQSDKAAFSRKK
jgi:hypothetical protein